MVKSYKQAGIFIFFSILLYCFILQEENKAKDPEQYKVWKDDSHLEEGDFLRRPPIFQGEAAAMISVKFQVSELPEVKVAVIVDRFNSFIYKNYLEDEEIMRHEDYKVKLAHFFAKEFNQAIHDKNLSFKEAQQFVSDRTQRVRQLQKIYDTATNHSLITPQQNYWEYKIDSMLSNTETFEIFSNNQDITVYFPDKPRKFVLSFLDEYLEGYKLQKYKATFWVVDLDFISTDAPGIEEFFVNVLSSEGNSEIVVNMNYTHEQSIFEAYSQDTFEKEIVMDNLLLGNKTIYWLRYRYPAEYENENVYKLMGSQFFSSFKLLEEDK